jgi:hypothetical protein
VSVGWAPACHAGSGGVRVRSTRANVHSKPASVGPSALVLKGRLSGFCPGSPFPDGGRWLGASESRRRKKLCRIEALAGRRATHLGVDGEHHLGKLRLTTRSTRTRERDDHKTW